MKNAPFTIIILSLLLFGCLESTATNSVPVSFAGFDRTVIVTLGQTEVELDGTGSYDLDSDLLNYRWRLESTPEKSNLVDVSNYDRPIASFIPDVEGDYVFSLVVDDGVFTSSRDIVVITVISK